MPPQRWMSVVAVGTFALGVVVPIGAQESKWAAPDDPTAKSLIALERQWAESACDSNGITKTILAEDFQGTSPEGKRYSKAEEVAPPTGSGPAARDCKLLDAKVRFFGDRIALVYGSESSVKKRADGTEYTRLLVWTDTWLKRNGKWQIVAAQDMQVHENPSDLKENPVGEGGTRERLVGTWRLVSAGTFRRDGSFETMPEYDPHPIGYLIYDPTGHMCVSLSNPNHRPWADPEKPTDAEKLRSYDAFFAYCGTYEIREKEQRVIHRPEMGSWPHYIGTDQNRNFRLEGHRLILSGEETSPGGERRRYEITWERIAK